jgi:hypothetical protein
MQGGKKYQVLRQNTSAHQQKSKTKLVQLGQQT